MFVESKYQNKLKRYDINSYPAHVCKTSIPRLHMASSRSSSLTEMHRTRFINKIDKESLERGDHIYAYRKGGLYSHHGIFIGEDRVIHFVRTNEGNTSRRVEPCQKCGVDKNHLRGVVKSCVDCFLNGHSLRRYRYSASHRRFATNLGGTCTTGDADPPDVTISRAEDLFNTKDFGDYDLLKNNCETFAVFCKTGKHYYRKPI
ncbi:putative endopeptidase, NLPC/P60 domain, LRAT-like domain-containing protein [Rosa chinensis]|uniref:Putative endopeptidase, NLPC/P60 domain, LRAT-like domain-containing protein n=1 Tax=Rosa chinensis TaxID=74649 RepID=A0A2P6SPM6_ROSCH|nr:putative endopeptidase, NLPC/P60 domain, LRAT-like domain-containing protein [Rosa chinensis]